jgi:wyosine [tRNA(Phe)-imidazoG37] synthetase (radical SAM superfamily)
MLSSPLAQSIRQSIIDGTYQYCNETQCGIIVNNGLNTRDTLPPNVLNLLEDSSKFDMPYDIRIDGDRTCNLSCPSCRTSVLKLSDTELAKQYNIGNTLYKNLFTKPTAQPIHISVSGSGEVFGSPMLLNLLNQITLTDFPKLTLEIHTNGLLSKKFWHKIQHLESAINHLTVSIDAATADTYEQVRRGGKWPDLLDNLEFLKIKKQKLNFKFCARMIVQQKNYLEMLDFYNFCKLHMIDVVEYSRLNNWGTWTKEEFLKEDALGLNHTERNKAYEMVTQVKTLSDSWFEGNFE